VLAKAAGGLAAELPDAEHVGPEGGLSGSGRKAESLSDMLKRVVTEHVRGALPTIRRSRIAGCGSSVATARRRLTTSRAASVSTHTRERCSASTS